MKGLARLSPPRVLSPLGMAVVSGPSMVPALRDGDRVLVRYGARIRPGDIVLGRFADLPGRVVIKRAERLGPDGWLVSSDNVAAGGDSRTHGPAEILGRAVLRWPGGPKTARVPRRIRRGTRG